jgi:hypothetical protein
MLKLFSFVLLRKFTILDGCEEFISSMESRRQKLVTYYACWLKTHLTWKVKKKITTCFDCFIRCNISCDMNQLLPYFFVTFGWTEKRFIIWHFAIFVSFVVVLLSMKSLLLSIWPGCKLRGQMSICTNTGDERTTTILDQNL